jgi:DNA (cytosine-5)-methyltransferase 1
MGYSRAGFDVVGVDLRPQPRYPFAFVQGDALRPPVDLAAFDVIHASPPCQAYTAMRRVSKAVHGRLPDRPDHLAATRDLLVSAGVPAVIENVPGSPMAAHVVLCGSMFGLAVRRHRWFELINAPLILTPPCTCRSYVAVGVYGDRPDGRPVWRTPGTKEGTGFAASSLEHGAESMGYGPGEWWGDWHGLKESIPAAYTEFIGRGIREAHSRGESPRGG